MRALSQDNVQVSPQAIAAFNRRDIQALRALNAPDVQADWSSSRGLEAGVYRRLEAVLRFYDSFFETFEEVVMEPDRCLDAGESVVVPNTIRFKGRDGIETVARSALLGDAGHLSNTVPLHSMRDRGLAARLAKLAADIWRRKRGGGRRLAES